MAESRGALLLKIVVALFAAKAVSSGRVGLPPGGGGGGGGGTPPPVPPPVTPPPGVPIGSIFDPGTNTWTDPSGQIWTQIPDGTWIVCVFAFAIGARAVVNLPEGAFPATVTRHETCQDGVPHYGLLLDTNGGTNASNIPETFLTVEGPVIPPPPPIPETEFRNVVFTFTHLADGRIIPSGEIDSNDKGDVRIQVTGEYRGEATFIQGFIGAGDGAGDVFQGLEGTSFITPIQVAQTFVGFGPLQTGNLGWPPWTFNPNSIFTLIGRLSQVSVDGVELREVARETALQIITTDTNERLSVDETELLVTDSDGTHPLVNPLGNVVHLSNFNFPWRFQWPVTNAGSLAEVVHFQVQCGHLVRVRANVFRFVTDDTLIGPSQIVPAGAGAHAHTGPPVVIEFNVSAQGFACSEGSVWRLELLDARGAVTSRVGNLVSFSLEIANQLGAGPLPAEHRPAIVGARSSFGSHF